jgi:hypothetical protein
MRAKALPRSADSDPRLAAVDAALRELEALCGRMEGSLSKRNWSDIDMAICDARRVTHALQNAMEDAAPARTPPFDEQVLSRLRYIAAIRDNQMKRMQQYRDALAQRLQLLARWRTALRSFSSGAGAGRSLNDVR